MTRLEPTYSKFFCLPRFSSTSLRDSADVLFGGKDGGGDDGLFDLVDERGIGPARRVVDLDDLAVGERDEVAHAGRGDDEIEIVLALQALLNDLHVQQAEEAAAEAEAECGGAFGLEEEGLHR